MKRKLCIILIVASAMALFWVNWSVAEEAWRIEQQRMFDKIGLKPGDKIDSTNWQKVEGLLPPSMVEWVRKGDLPITIGELQYDYDQDAAWKEASAKNEGRYAIDEDGILIDIGTGQAPRYLYGEPFPNIDWQNDPTAGAQVMENFNHIRSRIGNWHAVFGVNWISRRGYERSLFSHYDVFFYMSRPDGEIPNPSNYYELNLISIQEPYDIRGMVTLTRRFIDVRPDEYYAYIPSIRRVRQMSGANRSDPFAGSDYVNDDSNIWHGKNASMNMTLVDKKIGLYPLLDWNQNETLTARQLRDGSWEVDPSKEPAIEGHLDPDFEGAPWTPTNLVWVPREIYVVESMPKDRYYNYGKQVFYVDKKIGAYIKVIHDTAGEYWKTLWALPKSVDWDDRRTFSTILWYVVVDDRNDRASSAPCYGEYMGKNYRTLYMSPRITPEIYRPAILPTYVR